MRKKTDTTPLPMNVGLKNIFVIFKKIRETTTGTSLEIWTKTNSMFTTNLNGNSIHLSK